MQFKILQRQAQRQLGKIQIVNNSILYNNYMSGATKSQQINNSELQKSRVPTNGDYGQIGTTFNVQMTVSQANAIMKILPKSYSIHIDRTIKTKRVVKRKFTLDNKNYRSMQEDQQQHEINQIVEEPIYDSIQTVNYDQMIKKCQKILNLLRKNKNSWPFRDPVDPIVMGIPHYRDIITNPMDLRTVGQNLLLNKYSTMSQFYADIHLIISNSYTFNKGNVQFCTLTSQFQKYFQKLKTEPVVTSRVEVPMIKKLSTKTPSFHRKEIENKQADLTQRKQLAMKLKFLPKEELAQLVDRMNNSSGQKNRQLNLQTLPMQKIRFLQQYISRRQSTGNKPEETKNIVEDESSFQSESDS